MRNLYELPKNLPVPVDDGACKHLPGMRIPKVRLCSTGGRSVNLAEVCHGPCVLFFYPRTGDPKEPAPEGWDLIPGARGCTPQSCGFQPSTSTSKKRGMFLGARWLNQFGGYIIVWYEPDRIPI